jgi:hypothetical protein
MRAHIPWAEEDERVQWRNVVRHNRSREFGFTYTREQDRREADLMLHAQTHAIVAALARVEDGSRVDLRQGCGIDVRHIGITLRWLL